MLNGGSNNAHTSSTSQQSIRSRPSALQMTHEDRTYQGHVFKYAPRGLAVYRSIGGASAISLTQQTGCV